MKRICSLVLVLCMVLSMVVVPTLADTAATTTTGATKTPVTGPITQIGATDTTVTVGGVTYTVIRTAEDFKTKLGAGNFILANDIDFGPVATTEATEGEGEPVVDDSHVIKDAVAKVESGDFTFDGNGYTLSNLSVNFSAVNSLFYVKNGKAVVKNLKIVTGDTVKGANFSALLFTAQSAGESITIDNVDIHVPYKAFGVNNEMAMYIGNTGAQTTTLKDCELTGKFDVYNQINGGFLVRSSNTVVFQNCIADVEWNKINGGADAEILAKYATAGNGGNRNVPFVGEMMNGTLTFTDCTVDGTFTDTGAGKWAAPFVSGINNGTITLTRCKNDMIMYGKERMSGFVGGHLGASYTSHVVIEDCEISGVIWDATSAWKAEFNGGEKATHEFKGTQKVSGYVFLLGADKVPDAPAMDQVVSGNAEVRANGALAFYYAAAQKLMGVEDAAEIYGQQIGVDANPVKGGMTVYRRLNADGTYSYRNKPYREAVTVEIPEGAPTVTHDGVTYNVIRTVAEFKAMTDGNYILANDLDFTGETFTTGVVTATNITFRGNSHSLNNVVLNFADNNTAVNAALFVVSGTAKIQDVVINATLTSGANRTAVLLGGVDNVTAVVEGVTINADVKATTQKIGMFMGMLTGSGSATFQDCAANGTINSTQLQVAGFVGISETAVEFTDCSANLDIVTTNNRVTPYIGQHNTKKAANFTDCTASGTLVQTGNNYGAASFIGCYDGDNNFPTITFDGCSTDMVILAKEKAGGFVSGVRSDADTPTVVFKNCINNAVVISGTSAGAWVGQKGAGTFTVEGCLNNATVITTNVVTVVENENATAKVTDLSALNAANGELAYALANAQATYGFAKQHIYGQKIGTDAAPVIGGDPVYIGKDLADKPCYSNTPTFTAAVIPDGAATYNVGGVVYHVIRTAEDFLKMRGDSANQLNRYNYILANDIDMGGVEIKGGENNAYGYVYYWSGTFDGNGYSVTNFKMTNAGRCGFFDTNSAKVDIVVKNVTFGTAAAPISIFQGGSHDGSGVVAGQLDKNSTVWVENTVVYVDHDDDSPTARVAQKGAIVGAIKSSTSNESSVTLIGCTANGVVRGRNKIGGLMGCNYSLGTVTMIDCVNNCEIYAQDYVGGMLGLSQVGGESYFENCVNNGKINNIDTTKTDGTPGLKNHVGAIIGCTSSATTGGVCTIRNCENNGEIVGANSTTAMVGQHIKVGDTTNTLNIYTNEAVDLAKFVCQLGTVEEGVIVNAVVLKTSEIATEAELKAALETSGVYTLTADIALTSKLVAALGIDADVTLILAGHTITGEIEVSGLGALKIKNGTLKNTANDNAALTVTEIAALTLDNVTVEAKAIAAVVNGDLTAEDSKFVSANGNAIEFHKASQSTLQNCEATGAILGAADGVTDSSVDEKDGMYVTVNGGKYTAIVWESEANLTVKAGVFETTGDALTVKNGTVTIDGGSFKGAKFLNVVPVADATVVVTVVNGVFYGEIGASNDAIITLKGGLYEKALDNALLADLYEFAKGEGENAMYEIKLHTCTFSDVWTYYNTGSHKKQCTFPKCTEGQSDSHTWSDPIDNGDGTHSRQCSVCNGKGTANPHKLDIVDNGDGTHSEKCSNCNLDNKANHEFGDATSIAGNKHEKACATCGNVTTEDCTAGADGKCTSCGANVGTGTIVDPPKPGEKQGCKGSISGGLFVLLSVLAVPAVTVRKRREDR